MKRAKIRTNHEFPADVKAALEPDNTTEIETCIVGDDLVTTIERETTGGLQATVDDYVVNLDIATTVVQHAHTMSWRDQSGKHTTDSPNTGTTDSKEFSATDRQ